ncbi:MAG: potassium transporter TrkG [Clostridia bacterium]
MYKQRKSLTALQTLAIGFALIIIIGALFLMLPISNKNQSLSFLDALFTSTSATCVTGLVVCDTYTQFTFFGQAVILCLIQIGGLGFMTVAVLFSLVLRKRIGLKERSYLMEAVSSLQLGGVVRFARRILIGTAIIEGLGAALLLLRFAPLFGFKTGLWYAVFHSVSAFCNAGFDLMGRIEPGSSLIHFINDPLVLIVIMSLIVIGGIGFLVWDDLAEHKWHIHRYLLHTKIMLCATFILLVGSAALFFVLEGNASMAGMTMGEKIISSAFMAVTPRTAGFNTVDLTTMTEAGTSLSSLLMFVGAGAGSTGGGVKVTTVATILLTTFFCMRGREDVNAFHRRISEGLVRRAFCSMVFYVMLAMVGCFILLVEQKGISLSNALFETLSAIGTVGLSRAGTGTMTDISRITLLVLMYAGRVGSLSVAMAFADRKHPIALRNTLGKVIVG